MDRRQFKLCMVTTFYPPYNFGGDGIFVYRLANELAERGHQVEVVHSVDAYRMLHPGATSSSDEYPNHPNVTVHSLESKAGALSALATHQTGHPGLHSRRLKDILVNGRFDVVHFHNISLIGPAALSYGQGIKLYTMHEHWLVCPTHVLWKFNQRACEKKNCIPCTLHSKRPPQFWRYTGFLNKMLRHIDAFIAPSSFTAKKHVEMGLQATAPIVCIPHFLARPDPQEPITSTPSPHGRPYCLFVGRLEKLKGVQVLIEAFRSYSSCDLLIAGDGNYEEHLRSMAAGLPHVHFLGRVGYERLQDLYRHAVALLAPSVGYETFGMVVLEAFTQKTPAIVHNLGALPELIERSGAGYIYDDVAGLITSIEQLRSDPELRRSLGQRGYDVYLTDWTPQTHFQHYFELIESLSTERHTESSTS